MKIVSFRSDGPKGRQRSAIVVMEAESEWCSVAEVVVVLVVVGRVPTVAVSVVVVRSACT